MKYDFAVKCGRAGSDGPYAGGPHLERAVTDGTACRLEYDADVTFQDFPGYISASWSSPTGVGRQLRLGPYSNGVVVSTAAIKASNNTVYAAYARDGTYQDNQCQAQGGWRSLCWEGRPGNEDPCTFTVFHPITRANSPPPSVAPYVSQVLAELKAQAGTINSLPNPRGLVNLPTCFWLDNIGVPTEQDYGLVLAGPPDGSGRQIFYTYLIRLFFGGVDWNFDDPLGNAETAPHPACGQHPQLTAHNYQMISEKRGNDDGTYHVTANEKYQVTVDMYWADSYTTHHEPIDPGVRLPIVVSADPAYHQFIGQVEGIPVG